VVVQESDSLHPVLVYLAWQIQVVAVVVLHETRLHSQAVLVVLVSSFFACTPTSGRGCSSVMGRDIQWLCRPSRTQSLRMS
jgi:hypothetical protein